MLGFSFYLTMVLFIVICTILMLLVLIQKGRGGGLASAFGGAGANTAFGSKTGDVLTWATSVVFGIFLILAVALNLMADRMTAGGVGRAPVPVPVLPAPIPPADGTGSPATVQSAVPQPMAAPATQSGTTLPS